MTEDPTWSAEHAGATSTDPQVDGLLREVGSLDERPVAEHVAVYEAAHATLRRALDDRTD